MISITEITQISIQVCVQTSIKIAGLQVSFVFGRSRVQISAWGFVQTPWTFIRLGEPLDKVSSW
jgi:hypothetical protein